MLPAIATRRPARCIVDDRPFFERADWERAGDTYMAHLIPTLKLSPAAQRVLDLMTALWHESLPYRSAYADQHPDLHLNAWDAGFYQLKHLWRDWFEDEYKELLDAWRALADQLRPGVYKYGFLL
jgi:hypothetical protein